MENLKRYKLWWGDTIGNTPQMVEDGNGEYVKFSDVGEALRSAQLLCDIEQICLTEHECVHGFNKICELLDDWRNKNKG